MGRDADEIVWRAIDSLELAPWNARTNHDVHVIAESIRVNGFRDPIEVWAYCDGELLDEPHLIVAGAGRLLAARELDLEDVPVIEHDFSSEVEAKRYSIANNRATDQSSFDMDRLVDTLLELESLGELAGSGFALPELRALEMERLRDEESDEDEDEKPDEEVETSGIVRITIECEQRVFETVWERVRGLESEDGVLDVATAFLG